MIGDKVIFLKSIISTNSYAASLLETEDPEDGTVVIAEYQDKGKGQREAVWESEAGKNILCSIILYPKFLAISNQFLINQVISIGVSSVIEDLTGLKSTIKWPNDILVNEKKIAGILIENSLRGYVYSSCIAGIGLNVNQLVFRNYSYAAASLASLTGKTYDFKACCDLLFNKLDSYYSLLKNNEFQIINDLYLNRLFRLNESSMYEMNGKPVRATIRGVKPEGDLIMEMTDGNVRYIRTKEIKYLF